MADGGKRIDRGFLGETALRISRLLGVGGLISPRFDSEEKVQPVVLVGDATQIGYRGHRLRAFGYGETVPAAVGFTSKLAIKAPPGDGIIIDGWLITASGTTGLAKIGLIAPDNADPWAIGQTNSLWGERMAVDAERTPLLTAPQNSDALDYGLTYARWNLGTNAPPIPLIMPLMLLPGGRAIVSSLVTNTALTVTFWGRFL